MEHQRKIIDMVKQSIQIIEMMRLYQLKNDLKNVRKLANKLIGIDKVRIKEIKKIELTEKNYQRVMSELNEFEQIYSRG